MKISAQMSRRTGHFMPVSLLDSQLATLEPLEPDEAGVKVSVAQELDAEVAEIERRLALS